jgi:hypothetical protein
MDDARGWKLILAVSHVTKSYGVTAVSHLRAGIAKKK